MTGDDRDKCKMLVDLAISREGFSSGNALQELNKYNRPEFLELLSPLGDKPHIQMHYARLLATNENPATTDILLDLLRNPESDNNLPTLFECLQRKNPGDAEISKEILRYITNDSPRVRSTAIFVANYRGAIPALAEVLACLNDQSPEVRSMALYCFQGVDDPQVRAKIWELIHDPEDRVRENAYRALPLTNSTFYRFLTVSFLDRSRQVRRATDRLDLFWERSPVVISLMLLWPSMIAAAFAVIASGGNRRVLIVVTGIAAGYIAGLAAGYLAGRFYVGNPLFNAVILVPPFFIPFGLVLVGAVYRFGKKISLVLFPLIAASVCLTLSLVTWNNTLWLCVLAGFVILELVILLCPSKSYQSTIPARP